ncbi:hypothetical protein MAMT_00864 [Methylacidimicrobium tartarophylax]|uniref:Uncharacterized protein n=1 Tax=Methylacidimicrobium tartarophylax TaxID=1041768 RepID=A0A5E6MIL9_9BACT|nr:hypothetical protein MAMT_00864 [Methylacidimicrobium tartarophylax]
MVVASSSERTGAPEAGTNPEEKRFHWGPTNPATNHEFPWSPRDPCAADSWVKITPSPPSPFQQRAPFAPTAETAAHKSRRLQNLPDQSSRRPTLRLAPKRRSILLSSGAFRGPTAVSFPLSLSGGSASASGWRTEAVSRKDSRSALRQGACHLILFQRPLSEPRIPLGGRRCLPLGLRKKEAGCLPNQWGKICLGLRKTGPKPGEEADQVVKNQDLTVARRA